MQAPETVTLGRGVVKLIVTMKIRHENATANVSQRPRHRLLNGEVTLPFLPLSQFGLVADRSALIDDGG